MASTPASPTGLASASRPVEDYELATQRIAALQDSTRGDEEEHELQALIEAVKRWDAKHDDATGWKD